MDGGAWWAAVHGVAKSQTQLSDFTLTFHSHALEKEMATRSSVLAWRISGTGSLVGCCLWGRTESGTTEATQQRQQQCHMASQVALEVRTCLPVQETQESPGSGSSPAGGNGPPLQYSCLENSMGRGAWRTTAHGAAKSQALLSS